MSFHEGNLRVATVEGPRAVREVQSFEEAGMAFELRLKVAAKELWEGYDVRAMSAWPIKVR
jgi:hypothetical protein